MNSEKLIQGKTHVGKFYPLTTSDLCGLGQPKCHRCVRRPQYWPPSEIRHNVLPVGHQSCLHPQPVFVPIRVASVLSVLSSSSVSRLCCHEDGAGRSLRKVDICLPNQKPLLPFERTAASFTRLCTFCVHKYVIKSCTAVQFFETSRSCSNVLDGVLGLLVPGVWCWCLCLI